MSPQFLTHTLTLCFSGAADAIHPSQNTSDPTRGEITQIWGWAPRVMSCQGEARSLGGHPGFWDTLDSGVILICSDLCDLFVHKS